MLMRRENDMCGCAYCINAFWGHSVRLLGKRRQLNKAAISRGVAEWHHSATLEGLR